jgi:FKBP-type peptidyl-prolyl cis-trans isomerase
VSVPAFRGARPAGRAIGVFLAASLAAGACLAGEKPEIKDEKDRMNYSIGYQIGKDFKRQGVPLQPELILQGAMDAASGSKPLMSGGEIQSTLTEFKKKSISAERRRRTSDLAEGSAFLAENAKKEGVVTLRSGLQYEVLRKGSGKTPTAADNVTFHYQGTLPDGTEFDSSYRKGKPASARVDGVIPGWKEALQLMKEGDKWRIVLPPGLAYGDRKPLGGKTVIFELELLSVGSSTADGADGTQK